MNNHELIFSVEKSISLRPPEFEEMRVDHLVEWGRTILPPDTKVVLPFSGGLDSATISAFLSRAVGPDNVIAVHVAHTTTQTQETENALAVADMLGIRFISLDLHKLQLEMGAKVREVLHCLGSEQAGLQTTSNASMVYAVVREVARGIGGRLCGTLDGAEILTGYFPKESFYGDFLPLGGLMRHEVRELARMFGLPMLPEQFVIVPGCGSIVEYVNAQAGTFFTNEQELDIELIKLLNGETKNKSLIDFCWRMHHKTASAISGRPVYYPSGMRSRLLGQ